MNQSRRTRRSTLGRARLVCIHCHARKVKCDLELHSQRACSGCLRNNLVCLPRESRRPALKQPCVSSTSRSDPSPRQINDASSQIPAQSPYLGDASYLLSDDVPRLRPDYNKITAFSTSIAERILNLPELKSLPSEIQLSAYIDTYFAYNFHRFPVVNRQDMLGDERSTALCQAICMVGSMLRHPKNDTPLVESEQYYTCAKININIGNERDYLTILKTLCLLMMWNIKGHLILTQDCGWQWLGRAIKLLQQVGLHREATCARLEDQGTARRIAWCIFTQDQLISSAMGRPTGIKLHEFDVRPLNIDDFETPNRQSLLFIELTKLARILGRIQELHAVASINWQTEDPPIIVSLQTWLQDLPSELRLHDLNNYRIYNRDVSEVHITFYAVLIVYLGLFGDQRVNSAATRISLAASSCMVRLYQEIYFRDDINYLLGMNTWYLMLAAVPQLLYNSRAEQEISCCEELDLIIETLQQLQIKCTGATSVISTLNRLRSADRHAEARNTLAIPRSRQTQAASIEMDIHTIRSLFPFPDSFNPRLAGLLNDDSHHLDSVQSPAELQEDLGWIFDEIWAWDDTQIPLRELTTLW